MSEEERRAAVAAVAPEGFSYSVSGHSWFHPEYDVGHPHREYTDWTITCFLPECAAVEAGSQGLRSACSGIHRSFAEALAAITTRLSEVLP